MWEIIKELLPVISALLSAVISYFVASHKTKLEISKLKEEYRREDQKAYHSAFASVMEATQSFYDFDCGTTEKAAVKAVAELMVVAPNSLHSILKELDSAITLNNKSLIPKLRKDLETEFLKCK